MRSSVAGRCTVGALVDCAARCTVETGTDYCGETRTLDMHIGTLRHKLGDGAEDSRFIKTVRGVGYRFIGGSQG